MGIVLVLVVAGGGGWFWWRHKQKAAPPPAPATVAQRAPALVSPPDAAGEPAVRHPIEAARSRPLPSLAEADAYVKDALIDLLGRKQVAAFLNLDGVIRGFVATVDNLPNERAAVHLWPVKPMAGRFEAEGDVIGARNGDRYAPFVSLVSGADTTGAVRLYVRLYPLFQQAYEDLGSPGKYFNDRVVEVIDHLLATPPLPEPIKVRRIEAQGAARPATLYQFEDPQLERLSAGQKILLRMGPANAGTIKAKLAEIRSQIASGAVERKLGAR